jgi:hypothetical protein
MSAVQEQVVAVLVIGPAVASDESERNESPNYVRDSRPDYSPFGRSFTDTGSMAPISVNIFSGCCQPRKTAG